MSEKKDEKNKIEEKPKNGNGEKQPQKFININGKKIPVKGVLIQMKFDFQKMLWIGVVILMFLSIFELWNAGESASKEVKVSQMLTDIKENKVDKVEVFANRLVIKYKDGNEGVSRKENQESFSEILF